MNLASKLTILAHLKLLFAVAEIIRKLEQGKGVFYAKRNQFYSEYVKDNSHRPTSTPV